jgi:hypothetical protein
MWRWRRGTCGSQEAINGKAYHSNGTPRVAKAEVRTCIGSDRGGGCWKGKARCGSHAQRVFQKREESYSGRKRMLIHTGAFRRSLMMSQVFSEVESAQSPILMTSASNFSLLSRAEE